MQHFPNYVDDLQLADGRSGADIRKALVTLLDSDGRVTLNSKAIAPAVANIIGREITYAAVYYHLCVLRTARTIIETGKVPPKRPAQVAPSLWLRLTRHIDHTPPAAPTTPPAPIQPLDIFARAQQVGSELSSILTDLLTRLDATTNRVDQLERRLVPPESPPAVAAVQVAKVPVSFAQHEHLPRTTSGNNWNIYYATTFERSLKNLPTGLQPLLAKALRRFAISSGDDRGLDYKKLTGTVVKRYGRAQCDTYQLRVTSHYRVIINRESAARTFWIDRVLNRGQIPGYSE